jgi:hypothetical protein
MTRKRKNNIWKKYNKLTILSDDEDYISKKWNKLRKVECICECWKVKSYMLKSVTSWRSKSCGCYHKRNLKERNTTHWMTWVREFKIRENIKYRCDNINNHNYKYYWWRWIWYDGKRNTFQWFWEDMKEWYKENLTIDRIDNDWNYCKKNCRWSTKKTQNRNKTTNIMYQWKCLAQWCQELNLNYNTIVSRIYQHWREIKDAIKRPIRKRIKQK